MSANVDKVVKLYKSLTQFPALSSAKLSRNKTAITSVWSQRNIEQGRSTKFSRPFIIDADLKPLFEFAPLDISHELLSKISPSEQYRALVRDAEDKQFLEIWKHSNLFRNVDLTTLDIHGKVYTNAEFLTFEWSPDETKLLYIAEEKIPKSEPFYKRSDAKAKATSKGDGPERAKGEEFLFKQDWGEQLVDRKQTVIAQYDIEKDEITILSGIPADLCPGQVVYSPDGTYLVGVVYETQPRKLGLIYCTNRPSNIFKLDFSGNYEPFPIQNKSVQSPTFTPDGKSVIWLERLAGGPHAGALALKKTAVPLTSTPVIETVVDIVKTSINTDNGTKFYGLYNPDLSYRCFASGNRLVISSNQQNTVNTYIIDLDSGKITELLYDSGSQIVLDVLDDIILVNRRNYLRQDILAIAKLPQSTTPITWIEMTEIRPVPELDDRIYEYIDLEQTNNADSVKTFSAIYLGPKSGAEKSTTLIVWPHGGPHSAYANGLALESSIFLSMGYALLLINYRGSIGAGQDSVDFLPGRIGQADVLDCILATQTVLNRYTFLNPESAILVGGSHGGFLVTHLSGQYPFMFKAVIARNPVTDVAAMSIISDIPDWCYVEAGYEYTQKGPINDAVLLAMRKASPIEYAHLVKAPTLLQLGSKDLRVPDQQGIDFYHRLKANGVVAQINLYEDNHPLGAVGNEMNNLINSVLWIEKYR